MTPSCQKASRRGSTGSTATWPNPPSVRHLLPLAQSPVRAPPRPSHARTAFWTGTIGEVLMTKSTGPKPDLSQWTEPGEF